VAYEHSISYWTVNAGGIPIQGFGESDAVGIKKVNDDVEAVQCCDGGVVYNDKPGRLHEITLTLRYGSTADRSLTTLADTRTPFSFTATGRNGEQLRAPAMRVKSRPERKIGSKAADVEWTLTGDADYMPAIGGI
jgi:hypothetical protein